MDQAPGEASPLALRQRVPGPGLCFGLGLLLTLSLGATLGAITLLQADWHVGLESGATILIHAHSQIFGFVFLFVTGMVGHAMPRLSRRPLRWPWLLWVGAAAAVAGQLCFPIGAWFAVPTCVRLAEGLDLIAAAALAAAIFDATRHTPPELGPWLRLGALSLVVVAGWGCWGAMDLRLVMQRPAVWLLALWGFIAPLILGMSFPLLRMAGGFDVRPRAGGLLAGLWGLAVAVVVLTRARILPESAAPLGLGLQFLVALIVGAELGLFRPLRRVRSGAPFFASAYVWLFASLALSFFSALGLLPGGDLTLDVARHAFTIGCVTQMIIGVALRALPAVRGVALAFPPLAIAAYVLINGAVIGRLGRLLASQSPLWFWVSGPSGFFAVAALTCFGVSLVATVRRAFATSRLPLGTGS